MIAGGADDLESGLGMARYIINITSQLANGQNGPNFNLTIEAPHYIAALEAAGPALQSVLEESGLIMLPVQPAGPAPAPAAPAATIAPA